MRRDYEPRDAPFGRVAFICAGIFVVWTIAIVLLMGA